MGEIARESTGSKFCERTAIERPCINLRSFEWRAGDDDDEFIAGTAVADFIHTLPLSNTTAAREENGEA